MKPLMPFDVLKEKKGEEIIVSLKSNEACKGILKSFDVHLNIVLENATLIMEDGKEAEIGNALVRGDNILIIRNL